MKNRENGCLYHWGLGTKLTYVSQGEAGEKGDEGTPVRLLPTVAFDPLPLNHDPKDGWGPKRSSCPSPSPPVQSVSRPSLSPLTESVRS